MALLADKDAAAVLAALGPSLAALIATEIPAEVLARAGRPGAKARPASELADVARRAGVGMWRRWGTLRLRWQGRELAALQGGSH